MRLLIDATGISRKKAGVGVYALNLIESLTARADSCIFLVAQDDDEDLDYSSRPGVTMLWFSSRFLRNPILRLAFEQTVLPFLLWKHRIQVVHSLHYSFPLISFQAKTVVTIHDMTSFSMPEVHLPFKKAYYRFYIRAGSRLASALIFVSHSAKNDFIARFNQPRGLAVVIHHGKSKAFTPCHDQDQLQQVRDRYALPSRFILYVGMIEPRKNLTRLVQGFSEIAGRYPETALVIAGMKGWMYDDLFKKVTQLDLQSRVIFPGFIPEQDKRLLLCAAEVFAYISLYEGFGLPVLEALACGIPTLTSNTSSLPEVAGHAALLVDPTDISQIASALDRIVSDRELRRTLQQASVLQASTFTWRQASTATLQVYRSVLGHTAAYPEKLGEKE